MSGQWPVAKHFKQIWLEIDGSDQRRDKNLTYKHRSEPNALSMHNYVSFSPFLQSIFPIFLCTVFFQAFVPIQSFPR